MDQTFYMNLIGLIVVVGIILYVIKTWRESNIYQKIILALTAIVISIILIDAYVI